MASWEIGINQITTQQLINRRNVHFYMKHEMKGHDLV